MEANYWNILSQLDGADFVPCLTVVDPAPKIFTSPLIQTPGNYLYNGQVWQVSEGVLKIWAIDRNNPAYKDAGYRFVYSADKEKLYRALMWSFQPGDRDDGMVTASAISFMRTQKLVMTCENTARIAQAILSSVGITSRPVHWLNDGTAVTGYDDGHVGLEVFGGGSPIYMDFDAKVRFTKSGGGYASLLDIATAGVDALAFEELGPVEIWNGPYPATESVYNHEVWETVSQRAAWRSRVFRCPGWEWAGGTVLGNSKPAGVYFWTPPGMESAATFIRSLGYFTVTAAERDAMFYP